MDLKCRGEGVCTGGLRTIRGRLLWVALIGGYSVLLLIVGATMQKQGFYGNVVRPLLEGYAVLPVHYVRSWSARPDQLVLDIAMEDLRRLEFQASQALAKGVLESSPDDFVRASIRHGEESIRSRVRLKGDTLRPLQDGYWSFRVKTSGESTLLGMKQFSLHHPRERNYAFEWLFHRFLKREGLIGLRYEFVEVILNGRGFGIYAVEEHFEKRLLEDNRRREGPIVRFGEDLMWWEIKRQRRRFPQAAGSDIGSYEAAAVDGFHTAAELADPAWAPLYEQAIYLLEAFRRGDVTTSQAFEADKTALYLALCDVLGASHAVTWHNMRFYYNPVTSKLEPIGFDGNTGHLIVGLIGDVREQRRDSLRDRLFSDATFSRAYVQALARVAERSYLDENLADLAGELDEELRVLWRSYPEYTFDPAVLYENQEYVKTMLRPDVAVHAYLADDCPGRICLDIGNLHGLPVEVTGVVLPDGTPIDADPIVVLPARGHGRLVDYRRVTLTPPEGSGWPGAGRADLRVSYRIAGSAGNLLVNAFPHRFMSAELQDRDFMRSEPSARQFEWLVLDEDAHTIRVLPGDRELTTDLILPPTYKVMCGPGTTLHLRNGALVLSYSPLLFYGTADDPIRIVSDDGTGQGLIVLNAGHESVLEHTWFDNLASPAKHNWSVTGAVTFYESPVHFGSCGFVGARAEDALNVIRCRAELTDCVFSRSASDALDVDFCELTMTDCRFVDCGNDAVDASGSVCLVERLEVRGAGDKAISSGEASQVTARNLQLIGARIGVASKDSSQVTVEDALIRDCTFALSAYEKKPEFGPGELRASRVRFEGQSLQHLIETGSTVMLDEQKLDSTTDHAALLLEGGDHEQ